jgi:putative ABC transport system permease protein
MIKNLFIGALRHLYRNQRFSAVNFAGLLTGFIASFYLASYIYHETTFDTHHPDVENTYRLLSYEEDGSGSTLSAINYLPVAGFIRHDVPEVREMTRVKIERDPLMRIGDAVFTEKNFIWADDNLFDFFKIRFIHGSADKALAGPNSIVLTENRAVKLFGSNNPVGQVMFVDTLLMTVTGVMADMPDNTHLSPDIIGSLSTHKHLDDPWRHQGYLYLKLNVQSAPEEVASKITSATSDKIWWLKTSPSFRLQKMKDVHLHSSGIVGSPAPSDIKYLYIFGVVGLILICSTAFNYISLSVASFSVRAREIVMRKVLGANKKILILQPLMECLILSAVAALVAILILILMLPHINTLLHIQLSADFLLGLPNVLILLSVFLLLFSVSGAYPAIAISRFSPLSRSRNSKLPTDNIFIRKTLITVQFMIAIILTVSLVAIYKQLQYLGQRKLGFEKEQVVVLKTPKFNEINSTVMKNKLRQLAGISHVTIAMGTPFSGGFIASQKTEERSFNMSEFLVDEDYIRTLGVNIIEGRDFMPNDSRSVIINESMVHAMNWDHPLGQKLNGMQGKDMVVIGVVQDFQLNDPYIPIRPVMLSLGKKYTSNLLVRLDTKNLHNTIARISDQWKATEPNHPLEYSFLDEEFNALYKSELQFKNLSGIFCGIAILIACLGLYAFIAYSTQQRTKEIGIRKVLGASLFNVLALLNKDLLKLLGIAFLLATPIAWYVVHRWLEDFAYRIGISWSFFAGAGLVTMLIALATVSFQSLKAALMNPAESLRME